MEQAELQIYGIKEQLKVLEDSVFTKKKDIDESSVKLDALVDSINTEMKKEEKILAKITKKTDELEQGGFANDDEQKVLQDAFDAEALAYKNHNKIRQAYGQDVIEIPRRGFIYKPTNPTLQPTL